MSIAGFGALDIDLKGKTSGELSTVCPACSHTRSKKSAPCLHVDIDRGLYYCRHCGWSGRVPGAQNAYGSIPREKIYQRPQYKPGDKLDAAAYVWLTERRGIAPDVIERNRLESRTVWMPQREAETRAIAFPYFSGGDVVNVKYRDGAKNFRMEKAAERILYGLDDIDPAQPLIWVEGEIDKLAIETAGWRACVSIPNGAPPPTAKNLAGHYEPIDSAAQAIAAVKAHIIAVDNDDPGRGLRDELIRRLGAERCRIAIWPEGCKDANDVLVNYGAAILARCIERAIPVPIAGSFSPDDMADDLEDYYERGATPGTEGGTAALSRLYRPIPGQWTVIGGTPGSGKTTWLDWYAYTLMLHHGWRFAICSLETHPTHKHLSRLIRNYVGKPFMRGASERMTERERDEGRAWLQERVRFIVPQEDDRGGYALASILDLCRIEIARFSVNGIIIDPWNELEHTRPPGMREDEYIAKCLIDLRMFARRHNVHIWMVAHPVKLLREKDNPNPIPRLYDLAGGAMWANKCNAGITIHRHNPAQNGPTTVYVQKIKDQPEGGAVGSLEMVFDPLSGRYRDKEG